MYLKKIDIENFRSIKSVQITFDHNCYILVGYNESGKSNIIKAASYLNIDTPFSKDDIRDASHEEGEITSSRIRFVFGLELHDMQYIEKEFLKQCLCDDLNVNLIHHNGRFYKIFEFANYTTEALYNVDIIKQLRNYNYWSLNANSKTIVGKNFKKIKDGASGTVTTNNNTDANLASFKIVNTDEYTLAEELVEPLEPNALMAILGKIILDYAKANAIDCIVWTYDEKNLLPGKINFASFVSNPNTCVPLKNMFLLAGYYNIAKSLTEAQTKSNGVRNILKKVSESTSSHMKNIWPEWENQNVVLAQNGEHIEAGIEDEYNFYSLSRRSDGFKRFFTFMLMISAEAKTENIHNMLLLIDEPDICLHPTGIQYLKNELIKIGINNKVIASTHSIFMIDKDEIGRHLLVKKEKEITNVSAVDVSNITDEEVIYKALGFSLFELLRPQNIIFEGWRDKKILTDYVLSDDCKSFKGFDKIGKLHSQGVKDVSRVANLCENFGREYIIITDSDKPSKEKQAKFSGTGSWFCYNDIDGITAITTEDFIDSSYINNILKSVLELHSVKVDIKLPKDVKFGKVAYIESQFKAADIPAASSQALLNKIKQQIVENIKPTDISKDFTKVISFLNKEIKKKK